MIDPRTQFGGTAQSYLTSAVHSNAKALQRLIEVVQPKGGTILDVATGAGHVAYAFAPFVDLVLASDITEDMLQLTREQARSKGLENVVTLFAQAEALPIKSDSLDGLTCRVGAHHFADVKAFVEESKRALKRDGWFLLVDTVGSEDQIADEELHRFESIRDPSHVRNYPPSQWLSMVTSIGMTFRHHEVSKKEIEVEDWMERMRVSHEDRVVLRDIFATAKAGFQDYLQPFENKGKSYFHLDEIVIVATK